MIPSARIWAFNLKAVFRALLSHPKAAMRNSAAILKSSRLEPSSNSERSSTSSSRLEANGLGGYHLILYLPEGSSQQFSCSSPWSPVGLGYAPKNSGLRGILSIFRQLPSNFWRSCPHSYFRHRYLSWFLITIIIKILSERQQRGKLCKRSEGSWEQKFVSRSSWL